MFWINPVEHLLQISWWLVARSGWDHWGLPAERGLEWSVSGRWRRARHTAPLTSTQTAARFTTWGPPSAGLASISKCDWPTCFWVVWGAFLYFKPARLIFRLLFGFDKLNQSTNTETSMLNSSQWWQQRLKTFSSKTAIVFCSTADHNILCHLDVEAFSYCGLPWGRECCNECCKNHDIVNTEKGKC